MIVTLRCRKKAPKYQSGAVVLVTAVVLVIAGTVLAFMTAKVVLNETKISANDYRTNQAVQAAQAAVDRGMAAFTANKGIDATLTAPTPDQIVDYIEACRIPPSDFPSDLTSAAELSDTSDKLESSSGFYYYSNDASTGDRCSARGATDRGTLFGVGWSDDCTATRTISVCLGFPPLFAGDNGPEQPFIAKGSVNLGGNATIINRYTNISVWSGENASVQDSAFETYLRPEGTSITDFSSAALISTDETANTQEVSNADSGLGLDIVVNDKTLSNATKEQFWYTYFADSKSNVRDNAAFVDISTGETSEGVQLADIDTSEQDIIWIGDKTLDPDTDPPSSDKFNLGDDIGTLANPVTLFVNGDLDIAANKTIYGLVYVTGKLKLAGGVTIIGTIINESTDTDANKSVGTNNIVFRPFGPETGGATTPKYGPGIVIPGSWKDW